MTAAVGHCRYCNEPVYGRVDAPEAHPCCERWVEWGYGRCWGCAEAARLRRGHVTGPLRIPACASTSGPADAHGSAQGIPATPGPHSASQTPPPLTPTLTRGVPA